MRVPKTIAGALAGVALAAVAGVAHGETVTATGTAQAQVVAPAPLNNAKIVRAVAKARAVAIPAAFGAARNQATRFAEVGGLQLGLIQSIEEPAGSPFGYFGGGIYTTGRFGPNQYCGKVTTVRRGPRVEGRRGPVISRRRVTRCYKPSTIAVSVSVTYAATPIPLTAPQ
ncbi:hypothetical protein [Miltoncostaea oceani]|uniref:hypothetical protein n=1 Tax=Miltoncostaea oceani TaxID=2843216 RepID=UPI001C3D8137|nr:hypothetical protein [Miltoncostaea oceani]